MLNELRKAIFDRFDSDLSAESVALRAAVPGSMWVDFAPHGTAPPYIVQAVIDNIPVHSIGGDPIIEQLRIQFSIYSEERSTIELDDIYDLFRPVYDDFKFTVPGFNPFLFERIQMLTSDDPDTRGNIMVIDYQVNM